MPSGTVLKFNTSAINGKRFSSYSIPNVENKIYEALQNHDDIKLVTVNLPDEKKGEKIVLLINQEIEDLKQKLIDSQKQEE
jgi:hypothetical protein